MDERIHRFLDGELALEELTPDEHLQLESYRAAIRSASALSREEIPRDLVDSVMGALSRSPQGDSEVPGGSAARTAFDLLGWLIRPATVRLRPAYGLVAAAAAAVIWLNAPSDSAPAALEADPAVETVVFVQFRLDAPEASAVRLAGSFTGWQPSYALNEGAPGVWTILVPLPPGVHDYQFVVDDSEWRPDPAAPRVEDGFGGENSQVAVVFPTQRTL